MDVFKSGKQVCIVVGGGNIFRGISGAYKEYRVTADGMGMLATVINALALQMLLKKQGTYKSLSAIPMQTIWDFYKEEQ